MSKFNELKKKLMSEGKSEDQAGGIAYSVGVKKFGKKKMALASKEHKPASKVKV